MIVCETGRRPLMSSGKLSGFSSAFDEMLKRNWRELDALSSRSSSPALWPASRTSANLSSGSSTAASQDVSVLATRASAATRDVAQGVSTRTATSPAECALDEKLGPNWRYEVLDRIREGGEMIVRCRVTAPALGVSRTWHGWAPLSEPRGGAASRMTGTAGNVRFSLGGSGGAPTDDQIWAEQKAERQAIESALAACRRLL